MTADHPPGEPVDQSTYQRRARWGMVALVVRAIFQHAVVLVANVYLARTLSKTDFGIFAILQFALQLFKLVGDAGLAAALVQKETTPTKRELSSLWWLQLAVSLGLVAFAFVTAPVFLLVFPTLPESGAWLLRGLSLGLLFTMLRAIPFMLLEREVHFATIGGLELVGSVAYYGAAVYLASEGYGVTALVTASVIQTALIALAANVLRPFRPLFVFDWAASKKLVTFGLAFQGANFVGFANGALSPVLVGVRMGTEQLGIVQFAQSTAWFPTTFVGIVRRVYFPYFSRLQNDRVAFAREFDNAIALCGIPIFLFMGLFMGSAPNIVSVIYTDKWAPAVPALYAFSAIITVNYYSWIGGAALEGLGEIGPFFRLVTVATIVNWVATVIAVFIDPSPLGFAIGSGIHVPVICLGIHSVLVRHAPDIRPLRRVAALFVAGLAVAVVGRQLDDFTATGAGLAIWAAAATALFGAISLALDGHLRRFVTTIVLRRLDGWLKRSAASS